MVLRMFRVAAFWVMALLAGAVPCFPQTGAQPQIRYVGASTVGVFMKEAAKVYKDAVLDINTDPESGGGETAAAQGKTDIGGVAREVKEEILQQGVKKILIGKDAIGLWINAKNPVTSLSADQLKGIFTGKIANWKDVGGADLPISVYIVNPQSATRSVFQNAIMGKEEYAGERVKTIRPDPAIMDSVAEDIAGIGQLSFAIGLNHPAIGKVRPVNIGSQTASISNPDYPITRPLYLVTKGEPAGAVKAFIQWTLSEEGQAVMKKNFVGIK